MSSARRALLNRWEAWRSTGSVNRRIAAAAVLVSAGTALVKLTAAAKEVVVAREFGRTADVDAFFIAMLIPAFALNVAGGSFSMALVPTYVQVRSTEGEGAAQRVLASTLFWSALLLGSVTLALAPVGSLALPLLGAFRSAERLVLAQWMFLLLIPIVLLSGLRQQYSAILNVRERFATTAAVPALTPVATVLAVWVYADRLGVKAIALGTLLGYAAELACVITMLRAQGISVWPRPTGFDEPTRRIMGQWASRAAGTLITGSMLIVDQSMASRLGPGSVAALGYGMKVPALVQGLAAGLATASLPYLSQLAANQDWAGMRSSVRAFTLRVIMVGLPAAAVLAVCSRPIVRLLYERGAFTAADSSIVAQVQALYVLQLPFYLLSLLLQRVVASLHGNRVLFIGATIYLACDVILNLVLMRFLGVAGIALSTTIVTMISVFYLRASLGRLIARQAAPHR